MYKVKEIDYDKMISLLQLGIPADAWTIQQADKPNIIGILTGMDSQEAVKKVSDFYNDSRRSGWVRRSYENGRLVCYTLVEADDDEES